MKTINQLSKEVHENAILKGWYENGAANNIGERLALIHSEVSEALEADRKSKYCELDNENWVCDGKTLRDDLTNPDDIKFEQIFKMAVKDTFEDEIADIVIRCFDMSAHLGFDLEAHILAKMRYNTLRPIRHGGKKY